jgi:hypothetical protein
MAFCRLTLVICACCSIASRLSAQTLQWTREFGTPRTEWSVGVSANGQGNVFITGFTLGSLISPNAGGLDAFVRKYDANGAEIWTRQLGSMSTDQSWGLSADGFGSVYISGHTTGDLAGSRVGLVDAFLAKYDAAGAVAWTRQLGVLGIGTRSTGVSADMLGNVFISGVTSGSLASQSAGDNDAFVSKYDSSGSLIWTRQLGSSANEWSQGVSADSIGNVYISGFTLGDLGGPNAGGTDAFLSKFDSAGTLLWSRQLGTPLNEDRVKVSADSLGNVFISGYTLGDLGDSNAGINDAFISKYDANGDLQWTRQLGTAQSDFSEGVAADGLGNVYISGMTAGDLVGTNAGATDAFVTKYDGAGVLQWTRQFGSPRGEWANAVSADGLGNVYASGVTQIAGNLTNDDVLIAKISDTVVPEPTSWLICALTVAMLSGGTRSAVYQRKS